MNTKRAPKVRFKGFTDAWELRKLRDVTTEIVAGGDIDKDLILDDVSRGVDGRPAGQVNWKGIEGRLFIQKEFDRIIKIITDDEN